MKVLQEVPVDVKDANKLGLLGAADGEAIVDALDDPGEELRVDALGERVASITRLYRACQRMHPNPDPIPNPNPNP